MLEKGAVDLSAEQIEQGVKAARAKIDKLNHYKGVYLKLNDRSRWRAADEEQRILERLLAEYEVLRRGGGHRDRAG